MSELGLFGKLLGAHPGAVENLQSQLQTNDPNSPGLGLLALLKGYLQWRMSQDAGADPTNPPFMANAPSILGGVLGPQARGNLESLVGWLARNTDAVRYPQNLIQQVDDVLRVIPPGSPAPGIPPKGVPMKSFRGDPGTASWSEGIPPSHGWEDVAGPMGASAPIDILLNNSLTAEPKAGGIYSIIRDLLQLERPPKVTYPKNP